MKRLIKLNAITVLLFIASCSAMAQTCTPGGGVTCSPNLNLWILPQHYNRWDVPMNANSSTLDTFSTTVVKKNTSSSQTMIGPLVLTGLTVTDLGSTTSPVCPNGTGGALTTVGCAFPGNGFPITLGTTSIAASSTTTTLDGLTLTTTSVNGVTLTSGGSSSLFLDQSGAYSTPAGGGSVTEVDTGAGLTGGPITGVGTISIPNSGVTNAMLANSSMTLNGTVVALGSSGSITVGSVNGGATGSLLYQSAANVTAFLASPTTSGHAFVPMWQPVGVAINPTAVDLGTYLGSNVTASSPIVATPSTLGTNLSCPTCGTAGGGTSVGINGGGTLGTLNINAISPVADASYLALLPKISGADTIIEAPYATSSGFGVVEVDGTTITATAGVISSVTGISGLTAGQVPIAGSATTLTSSIALGNTGSDIPQLSGGLLSASVIPNNAANTSGTAANLSGTPALPNGTTATTQSPGDNTTKIATDAFVIANAGSLSGMTTGQVAIAGSSSTITSSIALGNTGTNIPRLSGGLLAASVIPNNAANTTGLSGGLTGGALGSAIYQSATNTTSFLASPTTSGHAFFYGWQPSGVGVNPTAIDLGTFLGTNVTASSPIVATPSTLGTNLSCPTCGTTSGGTSVGVNGGGTLGSLNINAISPVADASFLALTPKISGADMIVEAPYGTSAAFGVLKCGTGTTCASGVISSTAAFSSLTGGTNTAAAMLVGTGASLGVTGSGTINATAWNGVIATNTPASGNVCLAADSTHCAWSAFSGNFGSLGGGTNTAAAMLVGTGASLGTTGSGTIAATTAANLSGTPALPNGTTATTQSSGDNTTKLATDAFVQANAAHVICSGTINLPTTAITTGSYALAASTTCTGLLASDNISLTFNGSPLGITGYMPTTTGNLLTIYSWPTANTINVAVGNSTGATVTPGSATVNYRVVR